jgi:hypothetical protein
VTAQYQRRSLSLSTPRSYVKDSVIVLSIGLVVALSAVMMTVQSVLEGVNAPPYQALHVKGICGRG